MMKNTIWTVIVVMLISLLAEAASNPITMLKQRDRSITKIIKGKGEKLSPTDKKKLKDIINSIVDFNQMSKLSLKKHWAGLSNEQQKEFVSLFSQLIRNSSIKKLEYYRAENINYKSRKIKGKTASIQTIVKVKKEKIEIIYRMWLKAGKWMIFDMVIDDLSTTQNYKSSFNKIITKSKFEGLLKKLRRKVANLK